MDGIVTELDVQILLDERKLHKQNPVTYPYSYFMIYDLNGDGDFNQFDLVEVATNMGEHSTEQDRILADVWFKFRNKFANATRQSLISQRYWWRIGLYYGHGDHVAVPSVFQRSVIGGFREYSMYNFSGLNVEHDGKVYGFFYGAEGRPLFDCTPEGLDPCELDFYNPDGSRNQSGFMRGKCFNWYWYPLWRVCVSKAKISGSITTPSK